MRLHRRADQPEQAGPYQLPDQALPALNVAGAIELTRLALELLRRRGLAVEAPQPGLIQLADGTSYGLHNLSVAAAGQPVEQWPALVEQHFADLLDLRQADLQQGDIQQGDDTSRPIASRPIASRPIARKPMIRQPPSSWFLKLRAAADLPEPSDYAEQVLPAILALVAIDTAQAVEELPNRAGRPWLADLAAFTEQARTNLARLALPRLTTVLADDRLPASAVHLFGTDDFFGASRFLVLEQLLSEQLGVQTMELGCLVAVPNRHLLVVHVISDPTAATAAIGLMAQLAHAECDSRPGPISPHVYYRAADGDTEQLSSLAEDGFVLDPAGQFSAVLLAQDE